MVQVVFAGEGGQGIVQMGIILGQAAVEEGKNAVQTQRYGIQSRGGVAKSEVIVSEREIHYPRVLHPDVLVALSQAGYDHCRETLTESCLVIGDSRIRGLLHHQAFPFHDTAIELGDERVVNVIALGAFAAIRPVVSARVLGKVLLERLPGGASISAFRRGMELTGGS